jgi:hypothetical protein
MLRTHMAHDKAILSVRTPEEEELARKESRLAELEARLLDRELELATLQAELGAFDRAYFDQVGCRMVVLDDIEARTARVLAGEADDIGSAARVAEEGVTAAHPTAELRALFRQVARALHPDFVLDPQEKIRRTALMAEANAAYREADANRLNELLRETRDDPDAIRGTDIAARLVRCIRQIAQVKRRLDTLKDEINQLTASDLSSLMITVSEARRKGRDLLREMRNDLDKRIAAAEQRQADVLRARGVK